MNNYIQFKNLHLQAQPLVVTNIWDAASASLIQKSGAKALATSSASLAWVNGYADDGSLPLSVLLNSIEKIMRVINIPLTVDIENGYSDDPNEIVSLVCELQDLGAVGINIEDGEGEAAELTNKIRAIRNSDVNPDFFINARTDVLLRSLNFKGSETDEIIARADLYQKAGATGIFIPGLCDFKTINHLVNSINLPLNIMTQSNLTNDYLKSGVKRISMGPNPFLSAYSSLIGSEPEQLNYNLLNQIFQ